MNNKFFFRPVELSDANAIIELSKKANGGLSNLPKTPLSAQKAIETSVSSFEKKIITNQRRFLFVLADNENNIIGISGIKSRVGVDRPNYSYLVHNDHYPYLEFHSEMLGFSEIGSLFISPIYRSLGLGRLLSLARFLFINCFKSNFTSKISAEMRGYLTARNISPFWNAIGRKFIRMPFVDADIKSMTNSKFIEESFPKKPIYTALLSKKARDSIGSVHPFTVPAKQLLLSENFVASNFIDIFDGGPKLECEIEKIRIIQAVQSTSLKNIKLSDRSVLICNNKFQQFRCIKANKNTPLDYIQTTLKVSRFDTLQVAYEKLL
jgi:arginine N-succinyltransferase